MQRQKGRSIAVNFKITLVNREREKKKNIFLGHAAVPI